MEFVWFFLLGVVAVFYVVFAGTLCGVAYEDVDTELTGNECLGVWCVGTVLMVACLVLLALTGLSNIVEVCTILGAVVGLIIEVNTGWTKIVSGERYTRSTYVGRVGVLMNFTIIVVSLSVVVNNHVVTL